MSLYWGEVIKVGLFPLNLVVPANAMGIGTVE